MNVVLRRVALGVLVTLLCHGQGKALDVEHIVFEAGTIGETGSPAASGWEFIPTNTPDPGTFGATTAIEAVPNRTFQTGTNSEALVMHPWYFDNTGSFNHGAEWYAANDAGAEVQTVDAGEILYIQMEIFADFAGGGQWFKLGSAVGLRGNGDETRGFNNEGVLGDIGREMRTSVEADWTFGRRAQFQWPSQGIRQSAKAEFNEFLPTLPRRMTSIRLISPQQSSARAATPPRPLWERRRRSAEHSTARMAAIRAMTALVCRPRLGVAIRMKSRDWSSTEHRSTFCAAAIICLEVNLVESP